MFIISFFDLNHFAVCVGYLQFFEHHSSALTEEMLNKSQQKQEKIEEVFLELTSLETSLLEYGQYNLNRTTSEFNMSSIHMGKALS